MRKNLLFVILTVSLLLVACDKKKEPPVSTPISETPDAGERRTTISFAVYDWEQALYEDLLKEFEAANPNLHVQLQSINEVLELDPRGGGWPDDAWQRLTARADVINLHAGPEMVRPGLVRDLTPFMQADPNFQRDDFYPGVLESSRWDGGAWYLPTGASFDLIFYDKNAFDDAGVSYPEPGWTWDDFLDKARALTVRQGDEVTRWGFVQPWPNHSPFIEGRVGPLIDEATDPPTPRFDQPEVIEAVRWYADLYLKEEVVPFFEDQGPSNLKGQDLVENGKAAMWRESSMNWRWRKEQGQRGVVPYPVDVRDAGAESNDTPGSRTTPIWPPGLTMSAGTAHPNAAWRWMDFVSRHANAANRPEVFAWRLPARRSVAESSGFWDEVDAEFATTLRYAIDHSYVAHWMTGDYASSLQVNLEAILSGERSVDEALAEAQEHTKANLQEELARRAKATPVPTFVVVPPEDEEPAGEEVVTITFSPGTGALVNMQAYRDAAQQFHAAHPGIQVEVKMPDFAGVDISIQGIAGSADCFQWSPDIQDPDNRAAILNLEPFLDANPSFTSDDFYPALLEQFTWQGQLLGLPAELQPFVIEYNKDLFDAAGVDYPALDWTSDDFLESAVALTRGEGDSKQYGFVPGAVELNDMLLMIERRGARLIDESADPPVFTFNDPTTVEALRWYAGLSTEHKVKPVFLIDLANITAATSSLSERKL